MRIVWRRRGRGSCRSSKKMRLSEANVPYREWLAAARDGRTELAWLIERFDELPKPENERPSSTTRNSSTCAGHHAFARPAQACALPRRKLFFHRGPLIQRRDIELNEELDQPPPDASQKLPLQQGEKALDHGARSFDDSLSRTLWLYSWRSATRVSRGRWAAA